MKRKHINRFLEFLLIGFAMGVLEDMIAVKAVTGATIDLNSLWIVAVIALPFAAFSELVIDREDFHFLKPRKRDR